METFSKAFGVIAALCIGIGILAIFFNVISYLKQVSSKFDIVKVKGFVKEGRFVNVHLSNGRVFTGVRFMGFIDSSSNKDGIPYQFSHMVVCETIKGARILFRPDAVRIIEEIEDAA